MTLVKWKPRRTLLSPWNEWDNFLSDFFGGDWNMPDTQRSWMPEVDIHEDKKSYTVTVDLPGLSKKDININVKDNVLSISGERSYEKKDDSYHRIERSYGSFRRTFTLPDEVLEDKINATFKNGVLTIDLPKAKEVKPKEIEIKVS